MPHNAEYQRKWRSTRKAQIAEYAREFRTTDKLAALTRYGKNGQPQCCWEGCEVVDIDMLTLDHINNDGCKDRQSRRGGHNLYCALRVENYPDGFQTLCANHQLKKELIRRRTEERR